MSFLKGNAPYKQRAGQDTAAHPRGVPCAPCQSLPPCNGLKVRVPQMPVLKSLPQRDGVRRWGLWEVTSLLSSLGGGWDAAAVYALRGTRCSRESPALCEPWTDGSYGPRSFDPVSCLRVACLHSPRLLQGAVHSPSPPLLRGNPSCGRTQALYPCCC